MTAAEIKARNLIANRTIEQIITEFELTEKINDWQLISMIRGWYMDELEKRDAAAFDKWIDSDQESPRKFYIA